MRVETALAKVSKTPVQLRDPEGNYHKMTLAELAAQTTGFDWNAYFKAVGVTDPGAMDVAQPEFFKGATEALAAIPLADWKTYLTWNLLHATAPSLSKDFVSENFRFFGTTLRGTKELLPRWRRVLRAVDGGVGEALGEIYVRKNFPPEAKRRMLVMIGDLKDSLREHIERLDWMGPETKKAALEKLSTLNAKIGYFSQHRAATRPIHRHSRKRRCPYICTAGGHTNYPENVRLHHGHMASTVTPSPLLFIAYFDDELSPI